MNFKITKKCAPYVKMVFIYTLECVKKFPPALIQMSIPLLKKISLMLIVKLSNAKHVLINVRVVLLKINMII